MNIFEEFMAQVGIMPWPEVEDIEHTVNHKDFIIVDGEEGDYGIVRYYDLNGSLLAVKTVSGGDDYDVAFTELCFQKLTPLAEKWMKIKIDEIKQHVLYIE